MNEKIHPLKKYTRPQVTKTTNCPGCGNGIVTQAILRAIDELGMDMDDFVFVSGIGCAAWIPTPLFSVDTMHTTHGRPIAYATGIKMGLPSKKVFVVSGDGDLSAIGGNHLIHAARRNIDLTVVLVNNGIYGMTGGQTAPTTPFGYTTITSPYGNVEQDFDISALVVSSGASYVARWTTYHPRQMTKSIKKGIQKQGFAMIEAVSQCPVQFGRVSKQGNAVNMMKNYKQNGIHVSKAATMTAAQLAGKIIEGEFADHDKPELTANWDAILRRIGGKSS